MANETGWLIEDANRATWLRLQRWSGQRPGIIWTDDASLALRFARREDAESFWLLLPQEGIFPMITEHVWPDLPTSTSAVGNEK